MLYRDILEQELKNVYSLEDNKKSLFCQSFDQRCKFSFEESNWVSEVKNEQIPDSEEIRTAIKKNIETYKDIIKKYYKLNDNNHGKVIRVGNNLYHLLDFFLHPSAQFQEICTQINRCSATSSENFRQGGPSETIIYLENIPTPELYIVDLNNKLELSDTEAEIASERSKQELRGGNQSPSSQSPNNNNNNNKRKNIMKNSQQKSFLDWLIELLFGEDNRNQANQENLRKIIRDVTEKDLEEDEVKAKEQLNKLSQTQLKNIKSKYDNQGKFISGGDCFQLLQIKGLDDFNSDLDGLDDLGDLDDLDALIKQQPQEYTIAVSFEKGLSGKEDERMVVAVKKGDEIISFFNFDASSCKESIAELGIKDIIKKDAFDHDLIEEIKAKFTEMFRENNNPDKEPKVLHETLKEIGLTFVWNNLAEENAKQIYNFGKKDIDAKIGEQTAILGKLDEQARALDSDLLLAQIKIDANNLKSGEAIREIGKAIVKITEAIREAEVKHYSQLDKENRLEELEKKKGELEDKSKALEYQLAKYKKEIERRIAEQQLKLQENQVNVQNFYGIGINDLDSLTKAAFFTLPSIDNEKNKRGVGKAGEYELSKEGQLVQRGQKNDLKKKEMLNNPHNIVIPASGIGKAAKEGMMSQR